jgi:biopolymer transport protein ExbD/biopolymer transport protein TolR
VIAKRNRRDTLPVNAEINLTNLIDIAFVLLIIFMITAPMLQGGITLTLPKADVAPIESTDGVVVSIQADGKIFIDKAEVTLDDLGAQMKRYADAKQSVNFRADKDVPSGQSFRVMAVMAKAGVTNFGIAMEPEQDKR